MAKIINRARLMKKLRMMPDEIKKGIIPAMENGAQSIVDLQYHLAPVRSGRLRNTIDWTWGNVPEGAIFGLKTAQGRTKDDLLISIYAGSREAFYARWVEFGTRGAPGHRATRPQPFFFPAYRASRKRVRTAIIIATNRALKKVAQSEGTG